MRRREQLATCGEIAVSLAHEINNPLETITDEDAELAVAAFEAFVNQLAKEASDA